MDFSTTERALISLKRRQPPLPADVQSLATKILSVYNSDPLQQDFQVFLESTIELLRLGSGSDSRNVQKDGGELTDGTTNSEQKHASNKTPSVRWEPLAVGFHLTAALFEKILSFYESTSGNTGEETTTGGVFMDGPRVPAIQGSCNENQEKGKEEQDKVKTIQNMEMPMTELISFCEEIMKLCHLHLEHNEPRVRTLVAKVVGEHTKLGTVLVSLVVDQRVSNANNNSSENEGIADAATKILAQSMRLYESIRTSLYDHLKTGREEAENYSKSSTGALDDTTGWRALETNLYGVGSFINASSSSYFGLSTMMSSSTSSSNKSEEEYCKEIDSLLTSAVTSLSAEGGKLGNWVLYGKEQIELDSPLLDAVEHCCVTHINRHVRAAGINLLEQMVHACAASYKDEEANESEKRIMALLTNPDSKLQTTITEVLKTSLADNWSQVRMAGSVLCRVFFVTMLDYKKHLEKYQQDVEEMIDFSLFYPQLLPRMCLNRFYLAQGVKLYSHETWRIIFDPSSNEGIEGGLEAIANNAGAVCRYYVKMCDADNHVVREAGCQAVAELANKLGTSEKYADSLAPFVPLLLQALLMCFHDESWPVRDEACLACGTFCRAYPEECRPELTVLFTRWTEQLTDQIWSVREDAAVALGDAIEAYGQPMFDEVLVVLRKNLPCAKSQPAMTMEEYKRRQNDIDSHTNSQLYSCGSLAPKLRKGGAGRLGCSDCQITRPKAPWEATDGCIYLIRELCSRLGGTNRTSNTLLLTDETLIPIMTDLVDVCRVKHFPQSDDLRATLWKQLPFIARELGKQRFKRHYLHMFLDLLMKNMDGERTGASQLSVHAAGQCAEELAKLVGMSIFRGRLEEEWQVELLDRTLGERKEMGNSSLGVVHDGFSPFGPSGGALFPNVGGSSGISSLPQASPPSPFPGAGMVDTL